LTDNFRQADRTVSKILDRGYEVVFTGGGDGTVVYLINAVEQAIRDGKVTREEAPIIGVLRMGTGNALATAVGANEITKDLNALRSGASLLVQPFEMVSDSDSLFPFAGFGWDARILNDYDWFKGRVKNTAVENYTTGLLGYVASIGVRTIPQSIAEDRPYIEVVNRGEEAYEVDQRGRILETYKKGETLYSGTTRISAISTSPYWGYNIRMFPAADRKEGYASLRIFDGTITEILTHLPSFWRGYINESSMSDFLVSNVHIDLEHNGAAYQIAGDPEGHVDAIDWHVSPHAIPLAVPI
jgi:diacylglycerol kinase family enzyme